jgi:hypothetical protein
LYNGLCREVFFCHELFRNGLHRLTRIVYNVLFPFTTNILLYIRWLSLSESIEKSRKPIGTAIGFSLIFCFFCIKTKERAKTIFPALFVLHAYPFGFFSFNRKAKTNHSKATNNQDSYFLSIQNLYAKSWHCRQYP